MVDKTEEEAAVDLYWLPLGAGGHVVQVCGRVYETIVARVQRRQPCALYHSALEVRVPEGAYVIEQTPVPRSGDEDHGVVASGPVGARWAGRLRVFRYEVRLWRDGRIPDVVEAVESPRRLSTSPDVARQVLDAVRNVPTPVWGRDEFGTGEMWNSNAVIAWVIAKSGIPTDAITPPSGGRAPGWTAGLTVATRTTRTT